MTAAAADAPPVVLHRHGAVAIIEFCAPDRANAIDQRFADALLDIVHRVEGDEAIRCVLVRAQGRFFSVGGDIRAFAAAGDALGLFVRRLTATLHMATARLVALSKPVVVAVNGPAAGAGLSLALAGDVVMAGASARFTVAYPAIGLSPDLGATYLLPRLVGLRRAQAMLFLGRSLDAQEAHAASLVTDRVPDDRLAEETMAIAERLARMPTRALARTKRLLATASARDLEAQLEREAEAIVACAVEPHAREGIAAFLAGRPAVFA